MPSVSWARSRPIRILPTPRQPNNTTVRPWGSPKSSAWAPRLPPSTPGPAPTPAGPRAPPPPMPLLLSAPAGTLLFYNEPAEAILGRRFDETGQIPLEEFYSLVKLTAADGWPLPLEARPLGLALRAPPHRAPPRGLGFSRPLDEPGQDVHVWGPPSTTLDLRARLSRYLSPPLFPGRVRDLPRRLPPPP